MSTSSRSETRLRVADKSSEPIPHRTRNKKDERALERFKDTVRSASRTQINVHYQDEPVLTLLFACNHVAFFFVSPVWVLTLRVLMTPDCCWSNRCRVKWSSPTVKVNLRAGARIGGARSLQATAHCVYETMTAPHLDSFSFELGHIDNKCHSVAVIWEDILYLVQMDLLSTRSRKTCACTNRCAHTPAQYITVRLYRSLKCVLHEHI